MFYSVLFVFCFLFSSPWGFAEVPEKAQVFWEVKKPHVPASYLLGTHHGLDIVSEIGLPQEIEKALDSANILLLEVNMRLFALQSSHIHRVFNNVFTLLPGQYLSDYIGPELSRKFFHIIQNHPENGKPGSILHRMPDILNYGVFSRLTPESLQFIISTLINPNNYRISSARTTDQHKSLSGRKSGVCDNLPLYTSMDYYLMVKTLCRKNRRIPINYLETIDEHINDYPMRHSFVDNQRMGEYFKLQAPLFLRQLNHFDYREIEQQWRTNLGFFVNALIMNIINHYYNGESYNDIIANLPQFANLNYICPTIVKNSLFFAFHQADIKKLEEYLIEYAQLTFEVIYDLDNRNKKKKTQRLFQLSKEMQKSAFNAFAFCYEIDHSINEEDQKIIQEAWTGRSLLYTEQSIFTGSAFLKNRDLIQTQSMLSHLKKGKAFVAIGFAHLQGVRKYLEEEGYILTPIPLSSSILSSTEIISSN